MPTDTRLGDVVLALDIANHFRAATGQPQISDLLKGVPNDPDQCVLARTFNEGCHVTYLSDDGDSAIVAALERLRKEMSQAQLDATQENGVVVFGQKAHAVALAGETKLSWTQLDEDEIDCLSGEWDDAFAVILPDEVTWIAKEFDAEKYDEYDEEADNHPDGH